MLNASESWRQPCLVRTTKHPRPGSAFHVNLCCRATFQVVRQHHQSPVVALSHPPVKSALTPVNRYFVNAVRDFFRLGIDKDVHPFLPVYTKLAQLNLVDINAQVAGKPDAVDVMEANLRHLDRRVLLDLLFGSLFCLYPFFIIGLADCFHFHPPDTLDDGIIAPPSVIIGHSHSFLLLEREVLMRGITIRKFIDGIKLLAQPTGTTIEEMMNRLGVSKVSAHRFIRETVQDEFQFHVEKEKSDSGKVRHRINRDYLKRLSEISVVDLNLTLDEIVSLYFLKSHSKLYVGTQIGNEIKTAFAKLDAFVPDGFSDRVHKLRAIFTPSSSFSKDYSDKEKLIKQLTKAMLDQQTSLVEYHSFSDDTVKTFKIDPLTYFERNGGLYVFYRHPTYEDIRILAVERIQQLTPTDDNFAYPADFNPDELLENSFGLYFDDPVKVKIRFKPDQARYIMERTWAKGEKKKKQKDGSLILEMETSGAWEVKRWVMSFGADAEVIEPATMRQEIVKELSAVLENYRQLAIAEEVNAAEPSPWQHVQHLLGSVETGVNDLGEAHREHLRDRFKRNG
jgi:predicted DNA-binding transcriptional regulator YafY